MARKSLVVAGATLLASGVCQSAFAADWPQWRGPNRDGIAVPAGRLLPWPVGGPPSLWTGPNSTVWVGKGFSGLAIRNSRLFTLGNQTDGLGNEFDFVYCLDAATGNVLWTNAYACPLDPNLYVGGPSATPTVDGDRVYTLSKFGHLFCFNTATGHTNWQRNLIDDFGIQKQTWGFAGSPLVEGDRMYLNAGGHGLALNKLTGELIWLSSTNRGGYSSIVPFDLGGMRAAMVMSYNTAACVDLADGQLLWSKPWQALYFVNIPDPIVIGDKVFLTGYTKTGRIVRADNGSDLVTQIPLSTHMSPGVVISNHLYAFDGDAEYTTNTLKCLDLQTGSIRWMTNLTPANRYIGGALIAADNKLVVATGDAQLILAEARTNSFSIISQTPFSSPIFSPRCWTPPSLVGDRLYVRSGNGAVRAFVLPMEASPRLEIASRPGALDLTWPTNATGFAVEKRTLPLGGPDWMPVGISPTNDAGRFRVTLPPSGGQGIFRLQKP